MSQLKIKEKKSHLASIGNIITILILVIAIGVCAYAGGNLYKIFSEYKAGSDEYAKISDMVVTEKKAEVKDETWVDEETKKKSWTAPLDIDYKKLSEINPDFVGWLYVEALPDISYPVVHYDDNDFYLHRTFEKQDNFAGTIFTDCQNKKKLEDSNTIIYGHNMKNGSMFGQLKQFKLPETIQKSKYIWILTADEACKYEIFSCYTAEVGSDTYTLIKGPGKGLVEYAEKMQAKDNLGLPKREFDVKDKIITLSTCTGNEATRYVVQAVKVDPE